MKPTKALEGHRIETHPATDRWMMGDRYGTIEKAGRKLYHIRSDVTGKIFRIHPDNVRVLGI